jgi:hypothetical protein
MRDGTCRTLTRTTRTALATLCLGDAAAHDPERLSSYLEPHGAWSVDRSSLSRLSTRDRRAPRTRSLVVIPRQLVKAASAPLELDPPSTRAFQRHATNEPEMRLVDVCNPHIKDEHPMNRVASGFETEGAPSLTGGRCLHAATARFGQISAAPTGVLIQPGLATEPGPLMPPSPPRIEEFDPVRSVSAKTASTATQRDELRLLRSETPSIVRGALLGPFSSCRQRFPPTTGSRALFRPRRF